MLRDLRESVLYREAEDLCRSARRPGSGRISDASEIHASCDAHLVFTGSLAGSLETVGLTRICETDITSGDTRVVTFGPHTDRCPKFSPDGKWIAFLSDRHRQGDFQLHLFDRSTGAAHPAPAVEGWVEYLHWSPDGTRILLGVAGHGADVAGGQGAIATSRLEQPLPSWMPQVETGNDVFQWRSSWVYDIHTDRVRRATSPECNIWEAVWCGDEGLAAVVSPGPREGLWYSARIIFVDLRTGTSREIYSPRNQAGCLSASPSGSRLAVVAAVCSDRGYVAGDLHLLGPGSGHEEEVDTRGVDITYTEWRSDRYLLLAGHRAFETVVAVYDAHSGGFEEVWTDPQTTTGGRYVSVAGWADPGDCALVGEGFARAPEIATIRRGQYGVIRTLDSDYAQHMRATEIDCVRWNAPDGLEIHGWLLRRPVQRPTSLVMNVHGGPVWHSRPRWLGRNGAHILMLLERGYAVFFPNPRGSSGRGQPFAQRVVGDMGGADKDDLLSGLDHLVGRGIADPHKLGITGISYGGFLTCWLITQDVRFAAAVPVSPVSNHVSQHLISNIPEFDSLFMADRYTNTQGKYFLRSPVMHASRARTPTLNICGALDRCTPAEEAIQFHNALKENGVESALVIYPNEGHGVRGFPAYLDYAARLVGWFDIHMAPCERGSSHSV